jgi:ABC-type uncharacterized transport system involved in gliding motility auxiliary subunit
VVSSGEKSEKLSRLTEQALTNAVLRVTRSGAKTIYFVTGHGEKDLVDMEKGGYSSIRGKLTDQNYKVEPLLLMREGSIPDDAAVVVVAGPQKDPAEVELTALEDYLRGGGKAMFLVDPQTVPGLARWLTRYRVDLGDDIIVDKMSRLFGADYLMPVVAEYTQHPAAENFNLATFYPLARTVTVAEGEGPAPTPLASTSEQAWGETDLQRLAEGTAEYNEGEDLAGPVPVAVVAALQNEDGEQAGGDLPAPEDQDKSEDKGKIIVFGDSDFASNAYLNLQGNADLFLNAVSWLAEEGDLVAVRAKKRDSQPLMLSGWQANLVFWVPVVVMPLLAALVGVLVFTVRRRRQ